MMPCGNLTIALALLLSLSQLQCVVLCAAEGCPTAVPAHAQNVPPCHRHQGHPGTDDSAPCERQAVASSAALPDAQRVYTADLQAAPPSTVFPLISSPLFFANTALLKSTESPGESGSASAVLRI